MKSNVDVLKVRISLGIINKLFCVSCFRSVSTNHVVHAEIELESLHFLVHKKKEAKEMIVWSLLFASDSIVKLRLNWTKQILSMCN